ncbi:hypothetical protein B0H14DRAFT_2559281 [Mycena olivaceomarginata]|nr:hypothetical protein B0H14DRAFT_2559281 [Mycena olivaceomarginata]
MRNSIVLLILTLQTELRLLKLEQAASSGEYISSSAEKFRTFVAAQHDVNLPALSYDTEAAGADLPNGSCSEFRTVPRRKGGVKNTASRNVWPVCLTRADDDGSPGVYPAASVRILTFRRTQQHN